MKVPKFIRNMTKDDAMVAGRTRQRNHALHNEVVEGKKVLKSYVPEVYDSEGNVVGEYDDGNQDGSPVSMVKMWRKEQ